MDPYDDDIKVMSEARKSYEVDYKPLTHQQVKDLMAADIDYISTIFGVDVSPCVRSAVKLFSFLRSVYHEDLRRRAPPPPYGLE
jgi:hypothetical protein